MSSLFPQSSINSPVRYLKGIKQIVDDINNNCIHKLGEFHRRFWRTLIVPSSTLNVARILWIFQNNSQLHHFRSAFTINWFYVILYTILYVLFWWFFTPVVQDFCVLLRDLLELSKNDNPSNFQLGWRIFVTFLQNQLDSHRVYVRPAYRGAVPRGRLGVRKSPCEWNAIRPGCLACFGCQLAI